MTEEKRATTPETPAATKLKKQLSPRAYLMALMEKNGLLTGPTGEPNINDHEQFLKQMSQKAAGCEESSMVANLMPLFSAGLFNGEKGEKNLAVFEKEVIDGVDWLVLENEGFLKPPYGQMCIDLIAQRCDDSIGNDTNVGAYVIGVMRKKGLLTGTNLHKLHENIKYLDRISQLCKTWVNVPPTNFTPDFFDKIIEFIKYPLLPRSHITMAARILVLANDQNKKVQDMLGRMTKFYDFSCYLDEISDDECAKINLLAAAKAVINKGFFQKGIKKKMEEFYACLVRGQPYKFSIQAQQAGKEREIITRALEEFVNFLDNKHNNLASLNPLNPGLELELELELEEETVVDAAGDAKNFSAQHSSAAGISHFVTAAGPLESKADSKMPESQRQAAKIVTHSGGSPAGVLTALQPAVLVKPGIPRAAPLKPLVVTSDHPAAGAAVGDAEKFSEQSYSAITAADDKEAEVSKAAAPALASRTSESMGLFAKQRPKPPKFKPKEEDPAEEGAIELSTISDLVSRSKGSSGSFDLQ